VHFAYLPVCGTYVFEVAEMCLVEPKIHWRGRGLDGQGLLSVCQPGVVRDRWRQVVMTACPLTFCLFLQKSKNENLFFIFWFILSYLFYLFYLIYLLNLFYLFYFSFLIYFILFIYLFIFFFILSYLFYFILFILFILFIIFVIFIYLFDQ
jgi:hypothetical protein